MNIGVLKETVAGERRVALVPASVPPLIKSGWNVRIERGAGLSAGFPDAAYAEKGAELVGREEALAADCLLAVRVVQARDDSLADELAVVSAPQVVIGLCDPLGMPQQIQTLASLGVTLFSLELVPRITRAQSMDVLSSQATVAGYRAVLLAATALGKMFPMLTTAAGTITPAKVLVIGAGVAGLQAIATARRLGAVVSAYDVRPEVKEQVQSLGAKFVEMPLAAGGEGAGGYAKAMDEEFYRRQRELMLRVVAENDVVITTAAVPGKKAPTLLTAEMVAAMAPGSVIVDVAAERGGNCAMTRPGETVIEHGVSILGPTNLPSEVPYHASQMFAKNITTFLAHLVKEGKFRIDPQDEITRETLVAQDGSVVNLRVAAEFK